MAECRVGQTEKGLMIACGTFLPSVVVKCPACGWYPVVRGFGGDATQEQENAVRDGAPTIPCGCGAQVPYQLAQH